MSTTRFWILLLVLACALFGGLAMVMRSAQQEVLRIAADSTRAAPADQVPALAQTLRALKLITIEINTTVATESTDASWRGDVMASVRAPVTLYYGVDLAGLSPADLSRSPLSGEWTIRLPAPRRLATEVRSGSEEPQVKVTGLRLRDVAGEYHLGLARVRLHERAERMTLSPEDRSRLSRATQQQIEALVRVLTGTQSPVNVEFSISEIEHASPTNPAPDVRTGGAQP